MGSPDAHKEIQARILTATTGQVHQAAQRWLGQGTFTLEVHPFPDYQVLESSVDRTAGLPEVKDFPAGVFPDRQTAKLSNGLAVVLAERDAVPVVNFNLLLDAGYAADQFGLPGTASLALSMMEEGTTSRSALEISDELERLGATLSTSSNVDMSSVQMSALKDNLDASLDLFADVILNPSFPEAEFERLRKQQLAAIQREKNRPISMALRVFPRLLYGEDHAYGNPLTGSGTEQTVTDMSLASLREFHETWFKPNNATMIVVGDISMEELIPMLESRLGHLGGGRSTDQEPGSRGAPDSCNRLYRQPTRLGTVDHLRRSHRPTQERLG